MATFRDLQAHRVRAPGRRRAAVTLGILLGLAAAGAPARAADEAPAEARVPPRLSYLHGEVSFWRPGADAWAPAQVNTPLAPGDVLYVAQEGGLEIQVGPRAFVRAAAGTTLGLDSQEPDFLQFRLTGGHATLDLREVEPGHTVELATPDAVVTIERAGYYRAVVTDEATTVIARRGGQAMLTAADGEASAVASGAQVVVSGQDTASLATAPAPEMDAWDHWNYERTGAVLSARSAQHVAPGVYGVEDLDRHGTWRVEPEYGPVWVPTAVAAGWAPYSTGSWIWDPYYGWTWVDAAPWGWAPYHHGRWVYVRGHWAWAPGPVVTRPVYAPALVAFFGVGVRGPLGWCALGWGEPLLPWWGRPGFVGAPWWAGWGGPRVVNRVVVQKSVIVRAEHVTVFQNVRVRNAVVVVDRARFGHGPVRRGPVRDRELRALRPVRGDLAVRPRAASLVAAPGPARRPPERFLERSVVATRPPARAVRVREAPVAESPARIVPAPPRGRAAQESLRPRPERRESVVSPERAEERGATPEPGRMRPALPRDEAPPQSRRAPEIGRDRPGRSVDVAPRAPMPTPDGQRADRRGQRGPARSGPEQQRSRSDSQEALPQVRGGRPAPAAPATEPPSRIAPGPPARRPETPQRQRARPEMSRPGPTPRESVAPGRRGLEAPAARPPARVVPPSRQNAAPGTGLRGAGDRGRQQLRSRPEGGVGQPSPGIRPPRPTGSPRSGPATRAPRPGAPPARQR